MARRTERTRREVICISTRLGGRFVLSPGSSACLLCGGGPPREGARRGRGQTLLVGSMGLHDRGLCHDERCQRRHAEHRRVRKVRAPRPETARRGDSEVAGVSCGAAFAGELASEQDAARRGVMNGTAWSDDKSATACVRAARQCHWRRPETHGSRTPPRP